MENSINISDYIMGIFYGTDADGNVVLQNFTYDYENAEYNLFCRLSWKKADAECLCKEMSDLLARFVKFAERYDELNKMDIDALKDTLSEQDAEIWLTYQPLVLRDLYFEHAQDIAEKYKLIHEAQALLKKQATGAELDENERYIVSEYSDKTLTEDEHAQLNKYKSLGNAEAETRIGKGLFAQNVVIGGARICKLLSLNAPEIILTNEKKQFINGVILHRFGLNVELVKIEQ